MCFTLRLTIQDYNHFGHEKKSKYESISFIMIDLQLGALIVIQVL